MQRITAYSIAAFVSLVIIGMMIAWLILVLTSGM